ncbi:error-prone DNA polymerase [Ideonella sp.]|uniref:error-prone DNA polymerase n=1 Tax=Ideonella sp. TaxID=1929293 RepID=UPI002B465737|nr:error-prone DNA polymerase [Ideonella sp.]HJV68876.1 error-prone DNA polymerase [Ideonella sp.]
MSPDDDDDDSNSEDDDGDDDDARDDRRPGGARRSAPGARAGLPDYAELHCRSNFSFLTGASQPGELVRRAHARGYRALALTDECSLAGVVRAYEAVLELAKEQQEPSFRLIIGAEMRLAPVPVPPAASVSACALASRAAPPLLHPHRPSGDGARLVLLAESRRGYRNLSQWITVARRRAPKGEYLAYAGDLEGKVPSAPGLAGLGGCLALLVVDGPVEADGTVLPPRFDTLFAQATWLKTWFGADRCGLALALRHRRFDEERIAIARRVAALSGLPIVATGDVLMHSRSRKPLQDVLAATRHRCTVAVAGARLESNGEAHLRSRQRLAELYEPAWLAASAEWASRCGFSLGELAYEYPREIVPEGHTPATWLRALTEQGLQQRYGDKGRPEPAHVRRQVEHELALIARLRYEPYFLTVADVVCWARSQGILCQGRGSAANSVVCYALHVTEVDPDLGNLLFERFISAERNEPPDIDIDFEHQRREEVIQYIYRKYGRHRAALTGVVISYRGRSALRDVGRALGFDLDRVEAVTKQQPWWDDHPGRFDPESSGNDGPLPSSPNPLGGRAGLRPDLGARFREHGFDPDAPLVRLWAELAAQLRGFPRHLSQHPGGFVIARDDVSELVPVENAAMEDRTVIQWDKDDLDTLKLLKVDILALGMLSAIRRALAWVQHKGDPAIASLSRSPGRRLEMDDLPKEDPAVYGMLCTADAIGVFQVESRAQLSMLPRLQPRKFYDLVIEVAIVRPGPIQGGMVHPYLKRRSGIEPVVYPSAEVERALERTLGVPIFQEQVMQLAILAADFTPGEADQLRRAMAAWKRKGGLGPFEQRLVGRMVEKGYPREYAESIFHQIEGFGEYGFPESHAASFALLVYVSAWIKRHHPDAFLVGLLNSQPMGFYAPAQLVRDARAHGVVVRPIDVTCSVWDSTLEAQQGTGVGEDEAPAAPQERPPIHPHAPPPHTLRPVRLGFNRLAGFREDAAERIVAARAEAPFTGVEDLARRAGLDAHALRLLADADALAALAGHRREAAWAVAGVETRLAHQAAVLRATRTCEPEPPRLEAPSAGAALLADYRRTGLSLAAHPLALLRLRLAEFRVRTSAELQGFRDGQLARASGLVTHRQRPQTAKGVIFVTLEDETGPVNVIVWPQVAEAQRSALLASRLLTVYGIWQRQGEVRHLVAKRLVDHSALLQTLGDDVPPDQRALKINSRDFR